MKQLYICIAVLLLLRDVNAQSIPMLDPVCLAQETNKCVDANKAKILEPGPGISCPQNYTFVNGAGCAPLGGIEQLAGLYTYCEVKARADSAQLCLRNISFSEMLDQIKTLNGTMKGDMRALLSEFCKTYAADSTKCDSLATPSVGVKP